MLKSKDGQQNFFDLEPFALTEEVLSGRGVSIGGEKDFPPVKALAYAGKGNENGADQDNPPHKKSHRKARKIKGRHPSYGKMFLRENKYQGGCLL